MRVLLSVFMVFIVVFLIAVFQLSGMSERFFIRHAYKSGGESVVREASMTRYRSTVAPHYTINLEGVSVTPSLNLHLTTGHRLYDLKLMYTMLSKINNGSSVKIEWCSTFISGIVVTAINGVSVITPVDTPAFLIWLFMTVIGVLMFALVATIMVYSFRQ